MHLVGTINFLLLFTCLTCYVSSDAAVPQPSAHVAPTLTPSVAPLSTTSGSISGVPAARLEADNPPVSAYRVPPWPPTSTASSVPSLPPAVPVVHFPQFAAHLAGPPAQLPCTASQLPALQQQQESSVPSAPWPAAQSQQAGPSVSAPGSTRIVPYSSSVSHPAQYRIAPVNRSAIQAADAARRVSAARQRTIRLPRPRGPTGARTSLGPTTQIAPEDDPTAVDICVQLHPSAVSVHALLPSIRAVADFSLC